MIQQRTTQYGFTDIVDASRALFVGALATIPIGVIAGLTIGVFFFILGAVPGALLGIPLGFIVSLFGAAIGKRAGWVASGACVPLLIGLAILLQAPNLVQDDGVVFLGIATLAAALGGGIAGWKVSEKLCDPYARVDGALGRVHRILYRSSLYRLPMPLRFALAVLQVLPLIGIVLYLCHLNGFCFSA